MSDGMLSGFEVLLRGVSENLELDVNDVADVPYRLDRSSHVPET